MDRRVSSTKPLEGTCPICGEPLTVSGLGARCRSCGAKFPDDVPRGAPNPRDRFRDVVIVRPQLTARRGQVKGSRTWPLLVGLVLVALAIAALTLR